MSDERRWAERRIVEWALGELTEAEEERFRSVAADDPEFAELVELSESPDRGHVPAAMIARWSAAGLQLRGKERALALEHVRDCPQCREDLELVGGDLGSWVPPVTGPSRGWLPWAGGILIGAAAVLVLMFARPAGDGLNGTALPLVSPQALRGSGGATYRVAEDARALLIATPLPPDVAADADVVLRVTDPTGRVLSETRLGPPPWSPPSAQILVVRESGFVPGDYRVELDVDSGTDRLDLGSFRIDTDR